MATCDTEVETLPAPRGAKTVRRIDTDLRLKLSTGEPVSKVTGIQCRAKRAANVFLGQYLACIAHLFKDVQVLHVMFDETRVSGDATVNICIWDPAGQVAAWTPPQAHRSLVVVVVRVVNVRTVILCQGYA